MGRSHDCMYDIDDMMADQEEHETKISGGKPVKNESLDDILGSEGDDGAEEQPAEASGKVPIGKVEQFFSKIKVAAISLTGGMKIGDVIEIADEDGPLVLKVSSMQINKENVEEASDGDSIGIKVDRQVSAGSSVYLLGQN